MHSNGCQMAGGPLLRPSPGLITVKCRGRERRRGHYLPRTPYPGALERPQQVESEVTIMKESLCRAEYATVQRGNAPSNLHNRNTLDSVEEFILCLMAVCLEVNSCKQAGTQRAGTGTTVVGTLPCG
ncbi:hypothetical protein DPEC_G00210690 [Dallia pectoralis]|uniref:Uncharacterized protein n=1 Tax=Dallia pectoralis TaxID=75939 RepID=A0ACC2G629_DALPE|nr:hypothetical protein DPEC_G00210690 [Dallia pectoralis]